MFSVEEVNRLASEGMPFRDAYKKVGLDIGPKSVQTVTSLLERLATNAINWDIGRHSALATQEPQGQAPSLPS